VGPQALASNPDDSELISVDVGALLFQEFRLRGERIPGNMEALVRTRFRCHQAGASGKSQYDELWWIVGGKVFVRGMSQFMLTLFGPALGGQISAIPGGLPNVKAGEWKEKLIEARENQLRLPKTSKDASAKPRQKQAASPGSKQTRGD
jgi:hypothetical protein